MSRGRAIALNLKSDTVIKQKERCLIIKRSEKGKKVTSKKIKEINEKRVKGYKLMGKAEGMNLFHCLHLGSKYCKNFYDRVVAYLIVKPTKGKNNFTVAFYEKKESQ